MSSPRLPLRVRHGIREHWEDANTPVQTARSAVRELLGIDVAIVVTWEFLAIELDDDYPDKSTLVPSVAAGVQAFLGGLREILDGEVDPEWTDTLLERCNSCLRLFIGVSREAEVLWSSKEAGLHVKLPMGVMPPLNELQPHFKTKLLRCFDERQISMEDWADLSAEDANNNSDPTEPRQPAEAFPDISILPRPDQLLLKPPYHLAVYNAGNDKVEIQCSHSPTLELLADYLTKWCKTIPQQTPRPPAVAIKLHQSPFGLGPIYDRLTMSVGDRNPHFFVSPMIVLSFIEGVLGYKSMSADGFSWTFRKDVEFRKLTYKS
ncbi:uncharacterized protein F4807DRAFT_178934 [Annulohypoxylon truncatum]|uniref:uncharacterized protein n=1 Tax=Annulohypoxylon truncatum TaxID=327061 RepID=UPI002007B3FC|nr:uncharacterized protein F4807DRAFT_178934 [Annulohypoxylon truncatum]KAI1207462.1 hypothetical protein F4807DRAFT_178934 [Annulohypoxylon truncatum]